MIAHDVDHMIPFTVHVTEELAPLFDIVSIPIFVYDFGHVNWLAAGIKQAARVVIQMLGQADITAENQHIGARVNHFWGVVEL
jgi:hypothetical protein